MESQAISDLRSSAPGLRGGRAHTNLGPGTSLAPWVHFPFLSTLGSV